MRTGGLSRTQFRLLFVPLALSAAAKLVAAVWFFTAAFLIPTDQALHATLAVLFAAGFVWMARCLQPAIKPLFG